VYQEGGKSILLHEYQYVFQICSKFYAELKFEIKASMQCSEKDLDKNLTFMKFKTLLSLEVDKKDSHFTKTTNVNFDLKAKIL